MEGYFLEKLGFKNCGHCYPDDYNSIKTDSKTGEVEDGKE